MKQLIRLATATTLATAAACVSQPDSSPLPPSMFRGDPAHSGVYRTRAPLSAAGPLWTFETDGAVRSSPTIAGDLVLIGSGDGRFYALARQTGRPVWSTDVGAPINSTPAVAGGVVVFGSRDGVFHAVDLADGTPRWRFQTGDVIPWPWGFEGWDYYTSSPAIQDSSVVFGAGDGILYALNLRSGREIWRVTTEGRIRSSPAIAGGTVFVGSADGRVYAVDLATGREQWQYATDGAHMVSADLSVDRRSIIASAAVDAAHVYIGSRDGFMYALDRETGVLRWRASHSGSWAMSSPTFTETRVFSGTSDGRWVHALDRASGEEQWRRPAAGYTWSSPALVDSTLFIGDGGGYLRALDTRTGEQRWSYRVGGGILTSPVVSDGVVFFGSDDGKVYALHDTRVFPKRVVFWDEEFEPYAEFRSHLTVRLYLEAAGYQTLTADSLAAFIRDRTADRVPSAIVFAIDHVPAVLAQTPSDTSLVRRYLRAGGKIVWLGLPPMILERDPATGRAIALDRRGTGMFLGVDYSSLNFDTYNAHPTDLGRAWGLSTGRASTYAIDPTGDIDVLATDENGRAAIWIKGYGGPEGTGFVNAGMERIGFADLPLIRTLAEH